MAASPEKNAEIWSTRVQRELLALTGGSDENEKDSTGALPDFVSLKEHKLDIEAGQCRVDFIIKTKGDDEEGIIVVALDVSLPRTEDGSIDTAAPTYPFEKPSAILVSGSSLMPEGSTVTDGCLVGIDCDWTPSLHLNDAIQNVGLKIKGFIQQNEPFHPHDPNSDPVEKGVEEVMKGARRFGGFLSKTAKGLSVSYAPDGEPKRKSKRKGKKKKTTSASDINMGDEINLLEAPWVDARGVYSCKAIRRPEFVQDAMALAAEAGLAKDKKETSGTGFGAGMLRSLTQSAKSVLEESFLMVTDTHIIELKSNKLNLSTGTVTFAITIDMLAKLKFRRQESISLFFKPSPDDPLIFMCPDSGDCVHQIQTVLKRHGVKGKHTNVATQRAINEAMQLVEEIKAKERSLSSTPTVERVNEIMDLYRQAAERFEVAGDVRHSEVVVHMRKFLALPLTASILDGTYVESPKSAEPSPTVVAIPPAPTGTPKPVPEGEVLERTECQLEDDGSAGAPSADDDKELNEKMDNILKEAKADLEGLSTDEDLTGYEDGLGEDLADLDAMFNAADKELTDLMSS